MDRIYNRPSQTRQRKLLRAQLPPAEILLWKRLRCSQVADAKFRRQHGVGSYILDFFCPEVRLALEIDGESHRGENVFAYDQTRQSEIESLGIAFLRFSNQQIYEELEGVLETIRVKVEELRVLKERQE